MIVSRIDPEARSTLAAAEGARALAVGDTVLAQQKYTEAGDILKHGASGTPAPAEKNLLRFLAATQYYYGGEYRKALHLCRRIRMKHLSEPDRKRFESFRQSVEERSAADYLSRTRKAVVTRNMQGRTQEAIKLLQDHPYVLDRSALAWLRADLCYSEKKWRAAALFYADAIRFSDSHPMPVFLCAAGALKLNTSGQLAHAEEYTGQLLKVAPTALNLVAACAVRHSKLLAGDRNAGVELLDLFDRARAEFANLPDATAADRDIHNLMAHGYLLAAAAADALGDHDRLNQILDRAVTFDPTHESTETIRQLLALPGQGGRLLGVRTSEGFRQLEKRSDTVHDEALRSAA